MSKNLKQLVQNEFSSKNAIDLYIKKAEDGFFIGEKTLIKKYFETENSTVLDLGCGTGRTSIQLANLGFQVSTIDFVPLMIKHAKEIAHSKNLDVNYQLADACDLPFKSNSFDYSLFSNQGHTQIPGKDNRLIVMKEIYRVLKDKGIYIFSAHPRTTEFFWFWAKQWICFYILKPLGFRIDEQDYGDRFFERESSDTNSEKTFNDKQYIHIPKISEVKKRIKKAGFNILEIKTNYQISEKDNKRKNPPVFYVCQKVI